MHIQIEKRAHIFKCFNFVELRLFIGYEIDLQLFLLAVSTSIIIIVYTPTIPTTAAAITFATNHSDIALSEKWIIAREGSAIHYYV